jgi:hypothetical protein
MFLIHLKARDGGEGEGNGKQHENIFLRNILKTQGFCIIQSTDETIDCLLFPFLTDIATLKEDIMILLLICQWVEDEFIIPQRAFLKKKKEEKVVGV